MVQLVSTPETEIALRELTQPIGREDPYPRYAVLRDAGPLVLAEDGAFVASRYATCEEVLHDPRFGRANADELFATVGMPAWRQQPGIAMLITSMLNINPPDHTRLRRLVNRVFTPRQVARLADSITAVTDDLVDRLEDGSDFITGFAFPLPVAVIGELLGIPEQDRAAFQPLVRDWTMLLDAFSPEILARANTAAEEIRSRLTEVIEERRRSPREDLLSTLVATAEDGDRLSHEELLTTAALLFAAGFETTTHLLGNGVRALTAHPDQRPVLCSAERPAETAAIELLRFDSPVQITGRTALEDTQVEGIAVARGQRVVCYLGSGNHDPDRFTDPGRLDLTRREAPPLSFGGGIHYCLGAPLARLEAGIALPRLFDRFPDLHVSGAGVRRDGLTLRGFSHLPVALG